MNSSITLAALIAHCRKLTRRHLTPDAELLRRFTGQREAAAFEELVERYAPLVWGVCRRILPRETDCEDAFQAAFLSLVRQAGSIDPNRPLGAWLHTIAVRTAAKAQARLRRQPTQTTIPEQTTRGDIADELGNRELFRIVDEEIARLPALLREPFVLCCLEGRTRDEAAAILGCSVAAIKSRLERSRNLLRRRLEQRGFGLPAAFLVLGLTGGQISASLRAKALHCVLGSAPFAVAALVPAAGVSLASKLTLTAMSFVMVGVLGFGAVHVMQAEPSQDTVVQAKAIAPKSPQPAAAEKPQPRLDRFGDPLPAGAIRRFGTLRFRHPEVCYLAFTPDGKQLLAGSANPRPGDPPLSVFDIASGKRLRTIGKRQDSYWGFALSPDGKRIVCGTTGELWDLQTGKLIRELAVWGGDERWGFTAFSPDGKIVAAAKSLQAEIVLAEAETGNHLVDKTLKSGWLAQFTGLPQCMLSDLEFSPDGKYLAVRFSDFKVEKIEGNVRGFTVASSQVWLLDAATCTRVRTFGLSDDQFYGFAFQPGTGRLATPAKDGAIRFWDAETGKEVHRIAAARKDEGRSIIRFLDGGRHCALMCWRRSPKSFTISGPVFLTIVDVKDGRELKQIKLGEDAGATALSPDGRTLATGNQKESCVRIWDVETGAERFAQAGHRAAAILSLSGDGRTLIGRDGKGRVIHWDLRTGEGQVQPVEPAKEDDTPKESAQEWSLQGPRWRLVLHRKTSEMEVKSPDGSKLLRKVKWPSSYMGGALLSPDGRHLAVPVHDKRYNAALLWNPEREDEPHTLLGPPSSPAENCLQKLLFTHDSKRLLLGRTTPNTEPPNFLWVWDVATAKVVHKLPLKFGPDHPFATDYLVLSSDDRLLITGCDYRDPTVRIWDMETGQEKVTLTDPLLPPIKPKDGEWRKVSNLHLSGDERFLAVISHTNSGEYSGISVWETAAWKPVRAFPAKVDDRTHSMVFSRDGRSLFVADSDSTILEWDVSGDAASGRREPAAKNLNSDRLNELWQKLAATPNKAYPAVWELLDRPAEAAPFLIAKLAPVQPVEEKRVRQLLVRLDSESFAQREQASRQLLALGEQIVPMLRQALTDDPSVEAKRRIEGAIESLRRTPAPDQLRSLRALAGLEWIGRPEAVEHLRRLAGGAPAASLTQAAKAAWQRRKR